MKAPEKISTLVEQSARAHNVDPLLVESVMQVESGFNPYAISPKGAEGLMQLMPGTSRMLGVRNSFDPVENIEAGVKYLKYLKSVYQDDRLALAAYNAGPKAVEKFKEVPPYRETQDYVERVGRRYQAARTAADKAAGANPAGSGQANGNPAGLVHAGTTAETLAAQTAAAEVVEKHPKLEQFVDQDGKLHLRTTQQ